MGGGQISSGGSSSSNALSGSGSFTASGFTSDAGSTTQTNTGASTGAGGGGKGATATAIAPPLSGNYGLAGTIYGNYGNVLGMGTKVLGTSNGSATAKGSTGTSSAFGAPVLTTTTTNVTTAKGANNANANKTNNGFANTQLNRTPRYIATLSPDLALPPRPVPQVQSDLQNVIARSTALKNKGTINVMVEGNTVVLVGQVASPHDRSLVENMLRLDLRGRNLDNRLLVAGQP